MEGFLKKRRKINGSRIEREKERYERKESKFKKEKRKKYQNKSKEDKRRWIEEEEWKKT